LVIIDVTADKSQLILQALKGIKTVKTDEEKRACERHGYAADIAFSYFNREHTYDAETINLCTGGMCFKSNLQLQNGATVYIRLKKNDPNGNCLGPSEGLRSITLGEVKWCSELNGATTMPYGVGIKYYNPIY
jgi:hypothetical protein